LSPDLLLEKIPESAAKLRTLRPLWEDARVHVDTIRVLMRMSGAGAPKVFDKETIVNG